MATHKRMYLPARFADPDLKTPRSGVEEAARLLIPLVEHANTTGNPGPEGSAALKEAFTKHALEGAIAAPQNVFLL
jgi:hypothetical protein